MIENNSQRSDASGNKSNATFTIPNIAQQKSTATFVSSKAGQRMEPSTDKQMRVVTVVSASGKAKKLLTLVPSVQKVTAQKTQTPSGSSSQSTSFSRTDLCKECGPRNPKYADLRELISLCLKCKEYFCMMDKCDFKRKAMRSMLNHQAKAHSEGRNLRSYNYIAKDLFCTCTGQKQEIHSNGNTIGLCRKCKQIWCIVPGCHKRFHTLMNCLKHQHDNHIPDERTTTVDAKPQVCGNCGTIRPQMRAPQRTMTCSNCGTQWCTIGNCNREFSDSNQITYHFRTHKPK